jgi:hypothetical protein
MIRGITPVSGLNMDASKRPAEPSNGDPYKPICDMLHALLTRKRGYYGCRENPLSNALGVAEQGIEPWVYQVARIGEKCRRLTGPLGHSSIRETLADIAGHAIVAMAVLDYAYSQDQGGQDESEGS